MVSASGGAAYFPPLGFHRLADGALAGGQPVNVHIVCPDDGHIIPRQMRYLAEATGWTMSELPDFDADLNYYAPYIALGRRGHAQPSAALFTHYEPRTRKAAIWDAAKHVVDLRLGYAQQYIDALEPFGPVAKLPPTAVDMLKFIPGPEVESNIIGVAANAYGGGVKGVELVQKLRDIFGDRLRLTGRGWGDIPHRWLRFDEMPDFFRGLRVYVCTSLIEGGPAPVWEALACGVRVVVPVGVGACDELPDMPGVRHYEVGNAHAMLAAFIRATLDDVDRDALRALAEPCGIPSWVAAHELAFEGLLCQS